ncbi:MAG: D-cysteine desulfhydrase family protein [Bacteroidales bacterium]
MQQIINKIKEFPRFEFSILPTPVQKLNNLTEKYGANIFCMRDDLTGFAFGGNKTRKLDFLIADAKSKGFDTLIGVGANQSNFCRMTAAAGKLANMEVHLLLSGDKPGKPTANLLLDYLFGAVVHHTNSYENEKVEEESALLEQELQKSGKKVYRMPLGGSTPLGAIGYLNAFIEILNFSSKQNTRIDKIFLASGSGGTQAGLVLGQMLSGWGGEIIGISVGRSQLELVNLIQRIVKGGGELLHEALSLPSVLVDDAYIGEGYGKPTLPGESAISDFANLEGILLDKVYTGKAAAGMLDYIQKGKINAGQNILFIHTGGNIELFE